MTEDRAGGAPSSEDRVAFEAIFATQPTAYLVMSPELVIVEANRAYSELLGRSREELIGQYVFDAFPPSPDALDEAGENPLQLSFERARDTGLPDQMPLFHYDVLDQETGQLAHRAWSLITEPVLDAAGRTQLVLQRVEDVTDYVAERQRLAEPVQEGAWARLDGLEADLFARTLELRTAVAAQEEASRRLAGMAQVALQLTAAETIQDLTEILTGAGLTALGAHGGAIAIRDADRGTVQVTATQSLGESAQRRLSDASSRLPALSVAQTGAPVLLETTAAGLAWSPAMVDLYEETGRRAWIAVPLQAGGRVLGSLTACWEEERTFPPTEVELVHAFAAQCAQALARLQTLTAERRAAEISRLVSQTLQRSMLTEPFQPDQCQIAVRYLPATGAGQVGGDWYDSFLQADGALNLVIGDVVGHDIDAAAAMGQLRSLLRGIAISGNPAPVQILATLDTALTRLGLNTYATVGIARLEQTLDEAAHGITRLRWASAGHLPPIVVDHDGQLIDVPEATGRLMLGIDDSTDRGESVLQLQRGATVVLYTDGLVERPGSDLDAGVEKLSALVADLAGLPLEELCARVLDQLVNGRPDDDVALVAVRLHRQDRPRPAEAGPTRYRARTGTRSANGDRTSEP